MMRLLFIFTLIAGTFFTLNGHAASSDDTPQLQSGEPVSGPVTLRENIIVSGSYIRLKDLFTNVAEDKADTAVAYAPKPGRRATFDARWLYRVARAYGLQWRPLSADLNTVVARDSIIIQKDEIKDALMLALSEYNLPQNPELELSNKYLNVHVPSEIMADVSVENISYNMRSQRFAAIVAIGEKGQNPSQRIRVAGQIHAMLELPTPSRRLNKGDVIAQDDISWIKVRADRAGRDVITDVENIVGMTPKRLLRAEHPIRAADIERPVLVPKGSVVTIILQTPGMTLTSQGRAMENGSDGETIRVSNTKTKRTIDAIVIGSSTVTVLANAGRSAQLAFNQ